ncbi:hypothetical protein IF2G_02665 [Cordyceps javanica]|nr:hypothetical protein IF2G_02665 [Cordyceps javanica]
MGKGHRGMYPSRGQTGEANGRAQTSSRGQDSRGDRGQRVQPALRQALQAAAGGANTAGIAPTGAGVGTKLLFIWGLVPFANCHGCPFELLNCLLSTPLAATPLVSIRPLLSVQTTKNRLPASPDSPQPLVPFPLQLSRPSSPDLTTSSLAFTAWGLEHNAIIPRKVIRPLACPLPHSNDALAVRTRRSLQRACHTSQGCAPRLACAVPPLTSHDWPHLCS